MTERIKEASFTHSRTVFVSGSSIHHVGWVPGIRIRLVAGDGQRQAPWCDPTGRRWSRSCQVIGSTTKDPRPWALDRATNGGRQRHAPIRPSSADPCQNHLTQDFPGL